MNIKASVLDVFELLVVSVTCLHLARKLVHITFRAVKILSLLNTQTKPFLIVDSRKGRYAQVSIPAMILGSDARHCAVLQSLEDVAWISEASQRCPI